MTSTKLDEDEDEPPETTAIAAEFGTEKCHMALLCSHFDQPVTRVPEIGTVKSNRIII
jgi:hypothetical protein